MEIGVFWGCTIPARLPNIELTGRWLLDKLGYKIIDVPEFTCCPEASITKTLGENIWLYIAVRNLAIAEKNGISTLMEFCNGCYNTLKRAKHIVDGDAKLRDRINESLIKEDLQYRGDINVIHFLSFIADYVGFDKVKKQIVKPLKGLTFASHYGCHILRPYDEIAVDDPFNPQILDRLVKALGADPVWNYRTKLLCCGGTTSNAIGPDEPDILVRLKLRELKELEVGGLVTSCPNCFIQYDSRQAVFSRMGEDYNIPVFHIVELMAIALGRDIKDIGFESHRTKVMLNLEERMELPLPPVEIASLSRCADCGACVHDCPAVSITYDRFNPNQIMKRVLARDITLLDEPLVWECMECYLCDQLCSQNFKMSNIFAWLKELQIKEGKVPQGIGLAHSTFTKIARLVEGSDFIRKKIGLSPIPKIDSEKWRKVLKDGGSIEL
jgi:heterodisulfide reductase subunit B